MDFPEPPCLSQVAGTQSEISLRLEHIIMRSCPPHTKKLAAPRQCYEVPTLHMGNGCATLQPCLCARKMFPSFEWNLTLVKLCFSIIVNLLVIDVLDLANKDVIVRSCFALISNQTTQACCLFVNECAYVWVLLGSSIPTAILHHIIYPPWN